MKRKGRPPGFDRDTALEKALLLFWEQGFEQTGIDQLAQTMSLSTSSLYASFGDKQTLYLEALDRYQAGYGKYTLTTLTGSKPARLEFEALLRTAAEELATPDRPLGCMLALALTTASPTGQGLQQEVLRRRQQSLAAFKQRLRKAVRDGELPPHTDTGALADYLMTVLMGMSLQARAGATAEHLWSIAKLALGVWPNP